MVSRFSKQRELIFDILKGTKTHPTAEDVFFEAKKVVPKISLATVYRNLKQLADQSKAQIVLTNDKELHFDADTSQHAHFVCSSCNSVIDVDVDLVPRLKNSDFLTTNTQVTFFGVCKSCQNKN